MLATLRLVVRDLPASCRFYREVLGLPELPAEAGTVCFDLGLSSLRLTARNVAHPPDPELIPVAPGEAVYVRADDLQTLEARLIGAGARPSRLERWWGDRLLEVVDPDGYVVTFWQPQSRSRIATLALYPQALRRLRQVVLRLSRQELDLRQRPGGWSARQIVHHLADTTTAGYQPLLQTLGEPGSRWSGLPYRPERWTAALDYDARPIAPSLALLRAVVTAELELVERLPGGWERASFDPLGGERRAADLLGRQLGHLLEHLEEIERIVAHHDRMLGEGTDGG